MANNSRLDSMPFNSINDLMFDHWETHPNYPVERGRPSPLPELNRPLGYGPYEDLDQHERSLDDIMIQRRNPLYGERHRNGGRLSFRDGGSPGRGNPDDRTRDRGRRFMPHEMQQHFPAHPHEYNLNNPTPRHWHRKPWQFYNKAANGGRQNLSPQLPFWDPQGYAAGGQVKSNPFGPWSDIDLAGMTPGLRAALIARMNKLYAIRPDLEGKVIPPIHDPKTYANTLERSLQSPRSGNPDNVYSPKGPFLDSYPPRGLLPSIPGVTTPSHAPPMPSVYETGVGARPMNQPSNVSQFTPPYRNPNVEDLERMRVQQGFKSPAEIRQLPRRVPTTQRPEIGQTIDLRKPTPPNAEILPRDVGSNPESRMNWWDNMRENRNEPPMSIGPGDVIDWPKRQYGGRIGYADGGMPPNPFEFGSAQGLLDAEREAQLGIAPVTEDQVRENAARRQQYFQTVGRAPASRFPDNAPPAATAWPEASPTDTSREDFWRARDIPESPQHPPAEPATDQYSRNVWADPNSSAAMLGGLASGKIGRAAPYGGWKEEPAPQSRHAPGYQQAPMLQDIKEQQANMAGMGRRRPGLYDRGTSPILDDAPLSEWMVHHLAALMPDALVSGESGSKEQVDEFNAKLKAQGLPYHVKGMLGIPRRPEALDSMSPNDRERELYQRKLHAAQGIYSSATELPVPPFLTAYTLGHIDPATRAFIKGDYAELAALGVGAGAAGSLRMAWPIRSMPSAPFGSRDPEGFLVRHNWEDDARQKSLGQPARIHRDLMPVDTSRWEVRLKEGQSHPELSRDRVAQWEVFETPTRGGQQKKVAEFTSQHGGPRWHGNQQWLEIDGLKPVGSYQITPEMLKTIQPQVANIYPQSKGFLDQNYRIRGAAKNSPEQFVSSPMQKFEYYPDKPYQDVAGGTIPGLRHQNPFSLTQGFVPDRYRYQRLTTARDPYVRELFEKHAAERGMAAPPIAEADPSSWGRMQRLYRENNWMRRPQAGQAPAAIPEAAPVSPLRVETPALPVAANAYPKPPTMLEIDRMAREKGIPRKEMVEALEKLGLYTAPRADGGRIDRRPPWYRPAPRPQPRPSDSMKIQDTIGPDVPIYNNNMAPPPPPRMDYKSIYPEVMQPRSANGGRVQRYNHIPFWSE